MADRRLDKIRRRVASALSSWNDPHGHGPVTKTGALKGVDVDSSGEVKIAFPPSRPHCPCCLLDLAKMRRTLLQQKRVESVHIEVIGVLESSRWTKVINQ